MAKSLAWTHLVYNTRSIAARSCHSTLVTVAATRPVRGDIRRERKYGGRSKSQSADQTAVWPRMTNWRFLRKAEIRRDWTNVRVGSAWINEWRRLVHVLHSPANPVAPDTLAAGSPNAPMPEATEILRDSHPEGKKALAAGMCSHMTGPLHALSSLQMTCGEFG